MNSERYLDPPEEYDAKCECGHRQSDHSEEGDCDASAMCDALEKIIAIEDKHKIGSGPNSRNQMMLHIAKCGLSICADEDCECQRFDEADPGDDGDYAFDTAQDKETA